MKAFSTAAVLTVLAASTVAFAVQTQEPLSSQSRSVPSAAPDSYQRQDSEVLGRDSEGGPNSDAASCQQNREAMNDTATSAAFASTAMQDGVVEVALAGLALRKSHDSQVRQFALKMAHDYAQSNGGLDSIVKCEGLVLPIELDAKHNVLVRRFDARSARTFDEAYLRHVAEKHSETVALFDSASRSGDPDVAAFARKGLSMLHEHQLLADNLRAAVDGEVASAR